MLVTRWPDSDTDAATAMWAAGETARNIALKLGYSRNAVLGKLHRLNVATPTSGAAHRRQVRLTTPKPEKPKRVRYTRQPTFHPPPKRAVEVPAEAPVSRNIPFAKRREGKECAWIYGEPTAAAVCCGALCAKKSQFCKFHCDQIIHPDRRAL